MNHGASGEKVQCRSFKEKGGGLGGKDKETVLNMLHLVRGFRKQSIFEELGKRHYSNQKNRGKERITALHKGGEVREKKGEKRGTFTRKRDGNWSHDLGRIHKRGHTKGGKGIEEGF